MKANVFSLRSAFAVTLLLGQVACVGIRRQASQALPPKIVHPQAQTANIQKENISAGNARDEAPSSDRIEAGEGQTQRETAEAESHERGEEWFNKRHPDGGLRQKAVERKRLLTDASAATSGQWTAIGPQPIQSAYTYSGRVWGIGVDPRNSNVVYAGTDGGGVWKSTDGGTAWVPPANRHAGEYQYSRLNAGAVSPGHHRRGYLGRRRLRYRPMTAPHGLHRFPRATLLRSQSIRRTRRSCWPPIPISIAQPTVDRRGPHTSRRTT